MKTTEQPTIIIGAGGGIGQALVRQLERLQEPPPLVLIGRDIRRLKQQFPHHSIAEMDATCPESVELTMSNIKKEWDGISSVVHLVGSILIKPAHITKPQELDEVLKTNLISSFNVLRSATKIMMRQTHGGTLILTSSAAGRTGLANHEAISAAKAGIIGLTQSAAATYASKNIRINCVAPGMTETPLTQKILENPNSRSASESLHPLGRILQPDDTASAIKWLLSAHNITGQVIGVDCGLSTLKV